MPPRLLLWHSITICSALTSPVYAEDLLATARLALANDPGLRQAQYQHNVTQQALPDARAALLPEIEFNLDNSINQQDIISRGLGYSSSQRFNTRSYSLDLTQPLYDPASLLKTGYARDQITQSQWQLSDTRQALLLRTAQDYLSILSAQDNLGFKQAEKTALNKQLEQTSLQFEAGLSTQTEYHEIQAQFDLVNAEELIAFDELEDYYEALFEITNHRMRITPIKAENIKPLTEKYELQWWIKQAIDYNPGYQIAKLDVVLAKNEIKQQRAGHLPTLDLLASKGNITSGGGRFGGSETDYSSLTLQLSVPLFSGGLTTSKTRQAIHNHQALLEQREQKRRSLLRQIRNSFRSIQTGKRHIKALQHAIDSSQKLMIAEQVAQKNGNRTVVDALNAQQKYFLNKRDFSQTLYQQILRQLELRYQAGILKLDDLRKLNQQLQSRGT
ncbi:MAG: TolC family outer membrane protein [Gammaproteobacteria bacterium]|nr:TolC family outer membrane protein [Gammaproteobacteria bacterium]